MQLLKSVTTIAIYRACCQALHWHNFRPIIHLSPGFVILGNPGAGWQKTKFCDSESWESSTNETLFEHSIREGFQKIDDLEANASHEISGCTQEGFAVGIAATQLV
jgi:hypothetical protein